MSATISSSGGESGGEAASSNEVVVVSAGGGGLSTSLVPEIEGSRGSESETGSTRDTGSIFRSGTLGTFNRVTWPRGLVTGRVIDSTAVRRGAMGNGFSVFDLGILSLEVTSRIDRHSPTPGARRVARRICESELRRFV